MHEIQRLNIGDVVKKAIDSKPVLAICVGMQALMENSEENGGIDCLKIMPGQVKYFGENHLKATTTKSWDSVQVGIMSIKAMTTPWHKIQQESRFYFVHSYYVEALNNLDVFATCMWQKFAASVQGNLF